MGNRYSSNPNEIDMEKEFSNQNISTQHYIKKLDKLNKVRVEELLVRRKKGRFVGLSILALVVSIYVYTIHAVKQEKFMEDFDKLPPDIESAAQQEQ